MLPIEWSSYAEDVLALFVILFVFGSISLLFNKEFYDYFFPVIAWFKRLLKKKKH